MISWSCKKKNSKGKQVKVAYVRPDNKLQENLVKLHKNSFDLQSRKVFDRIFRVDSLHEEKARYHDKCNVVFCNNLNKKIDFDQETPEFKAAKFVSDYLLQNPDECQVCVEEILENFEGDKNYKIESVIKPTPGLRFY